MAGGIQGSNHHFHSRLYGGPNNVSQHPLERNGSAMPLPGHLNTGVAGGGGFNASAPHVKPTPLINPPVMMHQTSATRHPSNRV